MAPTNNDKNSAALMRSSKDEEEEEAAFLCAMQLARAIVLPAVLQAVTELDVFGIINRAGPAAKLTASEIVSKFPDHKNPEAPSMLDRALGLLVSFGVLHCSLNVHGERLYSLTPISRYYVPDRNGASVLPFMKLCLDKVMMPSWFELKGQILEGGTSFHRVHGRHIYEHQGIDSRFNDVFNNSMIGKTCILINKILESYTGFENTKQLVDVGGGFGAALSMITSKHPHIKGINFDLPHVIQDAPSYRGIEHVGGDMFHKIPEGDTIFLKGMINSFDDETCKRLLKNCYKALPEDGKVLIINLVLPEMPAETAASRDSYFNDVILLLQFNRGKERTKKEFRALAVEAGFKGVGFECGVFNSYIIEFFK